MMRVTNDYIVSTLLSNEEILAGFLEANNEAADKLFEEYEQELEDINLWEDKIEERLDDRKRLDYRQELSRISHNQAVIQDSGLFNIYNVKENEVDGIVRRIQLLDYIEWVRKTAGRFDFSTINLNKLQPRLYTITGMIKEEQN